MRLGILLALVAVGFAHECSVGNLVLENGVIVSKSIAHKECDGLCKRETIPIWSAEQSIVLLSCEDNHVAKIINAGNACNAGDTEDCYCDGNRCNEVTGVREELAPSHIEDFPSNIVCYVGYYASDQFTVGDLVQCGQNSVCMKVNGTASGYSVEVYACMPQTLCTALFPGIQDNQEMCNGVNGTTITGCCCTKQDCKDLMNPSIPPPPTQNWGGPTIQCYSGITLNGAVVTGGSFGPCQGDCASARIRTTYNGGTLWGEVFSCDPANIFSAIGVNGQCQSFNVANVSGVPTAVVTGCMCSSDKCIDPTVVPPVYPVRQLKCYTGLSNGTSSIGAEMPCNERCGRIKFKMNGTPMTYYMCAPYTICAGFGMAATEGLTYNPPQDEEIEAYCCSATDNCNVDDPNIQINISYVPTVVYPTICYGGIWVNGVPITNSAYGLCQGECASANFLTTFAGQTHNATIYTCDPVTMCSTYGIKNGCGQIGNGVTGCCCDYDGCLDPNRGGGNFNQLRCYSGISVPSDNIFEGGDMICDGMCSSLSTMVNSKNVTTYWCAPFGVCRYYGLGLGGNDNCNSITGADPPVTGCCCNTDNCNAPPGVNVTAIPARNEAPIVCYQGLHINGNNFSNYGYQVCHGECVSIMLSGTINSSITYATLYACDPASACASMGLRNNCSTIDGTVTACCCDSDACIDPMTGRQPGIPLQCYVGLVVPNMNISTGADMTCGGMCARVSTNINGNPAMLFHCVPTPICQSLGLYNSKGVLYLDREVEGYCCNTGPFCNTNGTNINTTGLQPVGAERPKACYSGIYINGSAASDGGWYACQGDCFAVNLNTTLSGQTVSVAVYSCDPTVVCRSLNVLNRCHNIEPGLQTCCCDTDACIDPTVTPPKLPDFFSDFCWVGVYDKAHNISAGAEAYCYDGQCASLTSNIAGSTVNVFACVPNYVCSYLGLYDDCLSVYYDRSFTACCCKTGYLCNTAGYDIPIPPQPPRIRDFPITCPSGLYVDGAAVTPEAFLTCDGDCASMTINATANGIAHSAMLFTCDPSRVCRQLNVLNTCASPEPGLTACCCDTDGCLDPMRGKFVPTNPLKCYVGVYSSTVKTGAEVYCDGKCAAMQGIVGNDNVTVFACIAASVCRAQELYDDCKPIYGDRGAIACCCDNTQNCNLNFRGMPTPPPFSQNVSRIRDYPIVCYNGIYLNGTQYIGGGGWQSCEGDCASIDLTSSYNGQPITASLYTCDPVRVCRNLSLSNSCAMIEPGLSGCCCTSDACIDPTKNPPRTPWQPLSCYVGVKSVKANISVGAEVICNGKCARLQTSIAGSYDTTTYHCVPNQICQSLELFDSCRDLYFDRAVTACCCDNANNCNVNDTSIVIPTPQPLVEFPIACYNGIFSNGQAMGAVTLSVCNGQCASVQISGTYNGQLQNATLYTCDPSSVCAALQMTNNCSSPEPGLTGCCCDTDTCLNPYTGRSPGNPLYCFVGFYAAYNNYVVGASIKCDGMCASMTTQYNGTLVKSYHCIPQPVCKTLELNNNCTTLTTDRDITACCCDGYNNCHVNETAVNTTNVIPANQGTPITCYNGIYVNGSALVSPTVGACYGQCASITYTTTYSGQPNTLVIYSCDPTAVCNSLSLTNNCGTIDQTGFTGCCCNTNMCVSPGTIPSPGGSTSQLSLIASLLIPFLISVYQLVSQ